MNRAHSLWAFIEEKKHFLILTHQQPDGDAIGSVYALCQYLKILGKNAMIGLEENIPEKYAQILPFFSQEDFILYSDLSPSSLEHIDAIVACDTGDISLLGLYTPLVRQSQKEVFVLDHHLYHKPFGTFSIIDSQASSTCEMLYHLLDPNRFTPEICVAIYLGIVYDTGNFTHNNAKSTTFEIVSEIKKKVQLNSQYIYDILFGMNRLSKHDLIHYLLKNIQLHFSGKLAIAGLTHKAMLDLKKQYALEKDDFQDLVSIIHSLWGVEISCLWKHKDSLVSFSLRSRNHFSVGAFAQQFGGGGHPLAAGCTLPQERKQEFIDALVHQVDQYYAGLGNHGFSPTVFLANDGKI